MFFHVLLLIKVPEDEEIENGLVAHPDSVGDLAGQWDAVNTEGLRKLLMQLDEERFVRFIILCFSD